MELVLQVKIRSKLGSGIGFRYVVGQGCLSNPVLGIRRQITVSVNVRNFRQFSVL